MRGIRHLASDDLLAVPNQDRLIAVFENYIILRITLRFFLYFFVKLVPRILGFPITKWHTDFVQ